MQKPLINPSPSLSFEELAQAVSRMAHLTGTFKLRSGTTSSEYFDKYRFESDPDLLLEIAKHLAPKIPPQTEILAGLELGGVPIATALSLVTGIPQVFVRKKAKDYGTEKLAEGREIRGKNLCVVEDVITTGGQVALSTQELRSLGAHVENVLCVIHRGSQPELKLQEIGLKQISLFTRADLQTKVL